MAYAFFFSYAREDAKQDKLVDRFFTDLRSEVAKRSGLPLEEAGFKDLETIPTGAAWSASLGEALQTSAVMVSLVSPYYVGSTFCGKEYQIFLERRSHYIASNAGTNPSVIFPIIWIQPRRTMPKAISDFQYSNADEVRTMMMSRSREAYTKYLIKLAGDIVAATELAPPVGRLPQLPPFAEVPNAFGQSDAPSSPAPVVQAADAIGPPTAARVVYIAAGANEFASARAQALNQLSRTDTTPYGKNGYFWKPFLPSLDRVVGELTFDSVRGYEYKPTESSRAIIEALLKEDRPDEMVVLVVDPWTIRLPDYQKLMRGFDARQPVYSGVVIPWNDQDQENIAADAELGATVRVTFQRMFSDQNRFRYRIRSAKDFEDAIKQLLAHLTLNAADFLAAQVKLKGPSLATVSPTSGPAVQ